MYFEFDKPKSVANFKKHKIDFLQAQKLWEDKNGLEIPAKFVDEERFALIGQIEQKVWVAFYTIRNNKIRIISVRRARENEERAYYES
jgi:uncharacterized DUF497 family protein